jgi:hypothetical protein
VTSTIEELAFELADRIVNAEGYADDPDESDRRAEQRDRLAKAITKTILTNT